MTTLLDAAPADVAAALDRAKNLLPLRRVHDLAAVFIAAGWPKDDAYDTAWNGLAGMRLLADIERRDPNR